MRASTITSYQERLNRVLIRIHQNLDEPLTIDRLAVACLSPFHSHLQRSCGGNRNRACAPVASGTAATRIAFTVDSITDTALAVGYETPAAFARAFRRAVRRESQRIPWPTAYNYSFVSRKSNRHGVAYETGNEGDSGNESTVCEEDGSLQRCRLAGLGGAGLCLQKPPDER